METGFLAHPDPGFKSPDPSIINLCDLNDGFDKVWFGVLYMKYNIFFYFYPSFRTFFTDPDFWPIRILTKKKSDVDPGKKTLIRNTATKY